MLCAFPTIETLQSSSSRCDLEQLCKVSVVYPPIAMGSGASFAGMWNVHSDAYMKVRMMSFTPAETVAVKRYDWGGLLNSQPWRFAATFPAGVGDTIRMDM